MSFKPDQIPSSQEKQPISINEQLKTETPETAKPEVRFEGQDAEVTVKRSSGELEGGWRVAGPAKKEGYVIVTDREGKKEKTVNATELQKLQPFQEGSIVPVIRSDGKLDSGWNILENIDGHFLVGKKIEGKSKTKMLNKSDLIDAQVAKLESEIESITSWGDPHPRDVDILRPMNKELDYWKEKAETIKSLKEREKRKAA